VFGLEIISTIAFVYLNLAFLVLYLILPTDIRNCCDGSEVVFSNKSISLSNLILLLGRVAASSAVPAFAGTSLGMASPAFTIPKAFGFENATQP